VSASRKFSRGLSRGRGNYLWVIPVALLGLMVIVIVASVMG
jgi:hypothetical protein